MKKFALALVVLCIVKINGDPGDFRPPAVPLIVFSPHISVWSFTDSLTDSDTVHWSGSNIDFHGLIDIDNAQTYRFLGAQPLSIPALVQNRLVVEPWRTVYTFTTPTNTLELILSFSQPTSVEDPYTYITFDVHTLDQQSHNVRIYFDYGANVVINDKGEKVDWNRTDGGNIVLTMGAYTQIPFGIRGDATRNNWGYAHLISGNTSITTGYQACGDDLRKAFSNHQTMPSDDTRKPRHADNQPPASAFILNLGAVSTHTVSSYVVFLYDDVYSVMYFGEWQVPYWRARLNNDVTSLINEAVSQYSSNIFDITASNELVRTMLTNTGGKQYDALGSLVTRQVTGGMTKTWSAKFNRSQAYTKEISSSGNIHTVDILFPSSPYFLWLYPELLRDHLVSTLSYVNNDTGASYGLAFAPHDLGTWPVCDRLDSEEMVMPMEETANIILMTAAVVQRINSTSFLQPYWNLLENWGQYLNSTLPDPGNQINSDCFEGPSPHNCNLALKGILGLGAYAILLNAAGHADRGTVYMNQAQNHANFWMKAARDNNNFRLQYDLPNSWSQKYNLVYQSILSLNLFPYDVTKLESDYYQTKLADFGVPLDSRGTLTKADWTSWIAAISRDQQQQNTLISKLYRYANESPDRVPLSDFYDSTNGHVLGFRARPVMGALFARVLLENPMIEKHRSPSKYISKRYI